MFVALLTTILLAASDPASQAAPAPAPTATPAATTPELKPGERRVKMVCRVETTTGSRFTKRTCMPLEEYERRTKESQEAMVEMQRSLNTTFSRGN